MINTVPINEQYSLMVVTLPPAQNTIIKNNPLSTPIAINRMGTVNNGIQLLPVNVNQSGTTNTFSSVSTSSLSPQNRIKVNHHQINPLFNININPHNNNQHINNNNICSYVNIKN